MSMKRVRVVGLIAVLGLLAAAAGVAFAQNGGYEIDWWTVDGGGGTSEGGDFALSGTVGQADAGTMSGGDYVLTGGFWGGVNALPYDVYVPLVIKHVSA